MIKHFVDREIDKKTIEKALDFTLPQKHVTISYFNDNGFAVLGFGNYDKDSDIEVYIVGFGRWASRTLFKHLFNYIFNESNCKRCTVRIEGSNLKSIKMVEKLGFKQEGYMRVIDVYIYSLLKPECKFL